MKGWWAKSWAGLVDVALGGGPEPEPGPGPAVVAVVGVFVGVDGSGG